MTTPVCPSYAGHWFPAEIISYAVWLYFRFPLSLRMVEEMLAARHLVAWIWQESSRIKYLWRLTDSKISSLFSGLAYSYNKVARA
jgi:hypothetical protein